MTLRYPKPTFKKLKDGAEYWLAFETTEDVWKEFVDAETTGMVIECHVCEVVHDNQQNLPTAPEKKKFIDLPCSAQAALMCRDDHYQKWIGATNEQDADALTKQGMNVASKRELDTDPKKAAKWRNHHSKFVGWQAGQRYEDAPTG